MHPIRLHLARILVSGTALICCVGGCDRKTPEEPPPPTPQEDAETSIARVPIASFFASGRPIWPEELTAVRLGMTTEAWWTAIGREPTPQWESDHIENVEYRLSRADGRVRSLDMSLRLDDALSSLSTAWGEPDYRAPDDGATSWFRPDEGLRAQLAGKARDGIWTVSISRYRPAADIVGGSDLEGNRLGFETKIPLLGSTLDEVASAYPDAIRRWSADRLESSEQTAREHAERNAPNDPEAIETAVNAMRGFDFVLEPAELGSRRSWFSLQSNDTRHLTSYALYLDHPRPAEIAAPLEHRFGPGIETEASVFFFDEPTKTQFRVEVDGTQLTIAVSHYTELQEIIGESPSGFAFMGGSSWLGKARDQIPSPIPGRASLRHGRGGEQRFSVEYDESGVCTKVSFVVHFLGVETIEEEVLSAFTSVYGEPEMVHTEGYTRWRYRGDVTFELVRVRREHFRVDIVSELPG